MAPAEVKNSSQSSPSCMKKISNGIVFGLESVFYRVGLFVGTNPVITIIFCLTTCGLCGIGLKTLKETQEQEKLWVPQSSRIIPEKAWVDRQFPTKTRFVSVIATGDDVLTVPFINALLDFYTESVSTSVNGKTFDDLCLRVGSYCRMDSILEIWSFNKTTIKSLNRGNIITAVNNITKSPIFGTNYDVLNILGGTIRRDQFVNEIAGAEATQMTWILEKNDLLLDADKLFEKRIIELALKGHKDIAKTYVYASRSFDDEGYGAINSDIKLLSAGFSIVFVFVMISLGKFNMVQQRVYVSLAGLLSVGLAILFAYGIATVFDVIYGPIQSIMPFLLLGIGVDDMFVVVEAWKNLDSSELRRPLPERVGLAMKHAGVSVTVTSITDIVAFGIGASTVIPALSAFCIYASLGILALYVLQSTFFVACLTLDEKRRESSRDACICCYRHKDYEPNKCSKTAFLPEFMEKYYGPFLMKLPVKIIVMLMTMTALGVFLWRFILLKQDFDLTNYIPSDSYAYHFAKAKENYFPTEGDEVSIYCGNLSYYDYSMSMDYVYQHAAGSVYVQNGSIISWFKAFKDWRHSQAIPDPFSESDFYDKLYTFLTSQYGIHYSRYIKLNSTTPPVHIEASYITLKHQLQPDSAGEILSMDNLRGIVDNAAFPVSTFSGLPVTECFAYSRNYLTYETNKVLKFELYRNLVLAGSCVLLVTLLLIANLWTSLLVFSCVIFTLIAVGGVLELWGVTIDTASSILLILSVGLAVDYSAHVGHTFMTLQGSREERSILTLKIIGPAVFNGGFSTFLAFVLLASSTSYGFTLFFRVFFTVVLFGLFHGLVYLPVVLSWVGPQPYTTEPPHTSTSRELQSRHSSAEDASVQNGCAQPLYECT
ncbi:protein patched homolog 1-like isoform X2 [Gigantopelta aegis]|uniref:protein patched homolog 1-like isoform X2 n=1 Tax=Gigantopelta aegis TaxID=1735272 RepID=UPI001B88AFE2|nr:protein patched homolog 1-like isoform X2 [Gigantopelta aegis]